MAQLREVTYELKLKNIVHLLYGLNESKMSEGVQMFPVLTLPVSGSKPKESHSCNDSFLDIHFGDIFYRLDGNLHPNKFNDNKTQIYNDIFGRPQNSIQFKSTGSSYVKSFIRLIDKAEYLPNGNNAEIDYLYNVNSKILNQWNCDSFYKGFITYIEHIPEAESYTKEKYKPLDPEILSSLLKIVRHELDLKNVEGYSKALTWLLIGALLRQEMGTIVNRYRPNQSVADIAVSTALPKKNMSASNAIRPISANKYSMMAGTYVERPELVDQISGIMIMPDEDGKHFCVIKGLGGTGKTELAKSWCNQATYKQIFWLTCKLNEGNTLGELFESASYIEKLNEWKLFDESVLIVVDNCDSEDSFLYEEVMCSTGNAHILFTTRRQVIFSDDSHDLDLNQYSDEKATFAYQVFEKNYTVSRKGCKAKQIQQADYEVINRICKILAYNALLTALVAIELRNHDRYDITDFAEKLHSKIGLSGSLKSNSRISYQHNDQKISNKSIIEILTILFQDFLSYDFCEYDKMIFSVITLMPAERIDKELFCNYLGDNEDDYGIEDSVWNLQERGWLKGYNTDYVELHPLIWELILNNEASFMPTGGSTETLTKVLRNWFSITKSFETITPLIRNIWKEYKYNTVIPQKLESDNDVFNFVMMCFLERGTAVRTLRNSFPKPTMVVLCQLPKMKKIIIYEFNIIGEGKITLEYQLDDRTEVQIGDILLWDLQDKGDFYLYIPNELIIQKIPYRMCCNNKNLIGINLSPSIKVIEDSAFLGCSGLSGSLSLPKNLQSIGDSAFFGCSGLSGSLLLPKNLQSIGDSAFVGCSGFSGPLKLPDTLQSIGEASFAGCEGLDGPLLLPANLKLIKDFTFYGCYGLSGQLKLPANLQSIGDFAFTDCSGFYGSLKLPTNLQYIGDYAFSGCSGFSGLLELPFNLQHIGYSAFNDCNMIFDSLSFSTYQQNEGISEVTKQIDNYIYIYYRTTGIPNYPSSLEAIGDSSFEYCSPNNSCDNLNKIEILEGIKRIDDYRYMFSKATGMLRLPSSLEAIGDAAFRGCSGLSGPLSLPKNLQSIGDSAFAGCSGLSGSLELPDNIQAIGDAAFKGCSSLSGSLSLPINLKSIGQSAFDYCSGFSGSLKFPTNLQYIGANAFRGCSGFSGSLTLPSNIQYIGPNAFDNCNFSKLIFISKTVNINYLGILSESTNIYGYPNSTAERYAYEYNLNFFLLND